MQLSISEEPFKSALHKPCGLGIPIDVGRRGSASNLGHGDGAEHRHNRRQRSSLNNEAKQWAFYDDETNGTDM